MRVWAYTYNIYLSNCNWWSKNTCTRPLNATETRWSYGRMDILAETLHVAFPNFFAWFHRLKDHFPHGVVKETQIPIAKDHFGKTVQTFFVGHFILGTIEHQYCFVFVYMYLYVSSFLSFTLEFKLSMWMTIYVFVANIHQHLPDLCKLKCIVLCVYQVTALGHLILVK